MLAARPVLKGLPTGQVVRRHAGPVKALCCRAAQPSVLQSPLMSMRARCGPLPSANAKLWLRAIPGTGTISTNSFSIQMERFSRSALDCLRQSANP